MTTRPRMVAARAASWWVVVSAAPLLLGLALALALAADAGQGPPAAADDGLAAQLERGREVYAFSCTTCHGATGAGFAEARAAFPADHYDCIRCHGPRNPPQMTPQQIELSQSVFSLGVAPPLADADALARFGTAAALYAYVRATMPRWDPGRLADDAYLDVTAFVLHLAGIHPSDAPLRFETLATVPLPAARPQP